MVSNTIWVNRQDFMMTGFNRIIEVDVLLDIGCGIRPQNCIKPYVYICCEPYDEYINVLKKKVENNTDSLYVILNYDWEAVINNFGERSVDTVFLLDVIEHLDKETGERLLKQTEKIARKQVVIFTPLGFVEQHTLEDGKDAWGLNGAEWQEHKSGWLPEDFDESWEIIACKNFHEYNNVGEKLDEPFGALWAIKNINEARDFVTTVINYHPTLLQTILEQSKKNITLLQEEKKYIDKKNGTLYEENQNLIQSLQYQQKENGELNQKVYSLVDEIEQLSEQISKLQTEDNDLTEKSQILQMQYSQLNQENKQLHLQNNLLKEELVGIQLVNNQLNTRATYLQTLADELNRVTNTRSWKLLNKVYKIKSKII